MKALLINPCVRLRDTSSNSGAQRNRRIRYPSGLYSISATLQAHRFQAPVLDLEIEDMDLKKAIRRERPDVVGITAATANRFEAINAARQIREVSPDLVIVVGGPHFTFTAEDTLKNVSEIDIVVRGEGEATLLELMQTLDGSSSLESIAGISYAVNGQINHNPDRSAIRDLDGLPTIKWEQIPWEKYDYRFMNMPCAHVQTSRGCPINCTFCSTTKMWGKHLRWKSPGKVVDEIAYLLSKYKFQAIFFDDDTFTLNRRHLLSICEEIRTRKLEFGWICQTRVDTVNRNVLEIMKRAGCTYIYFGIETGSQAMLDSIRKKISREQVLQTVKACKAVGLMCHALFMYALPGESDEDRRLTFELMRELISAGIDNLSANPTIIYPGTDVEATARKVGVLPPDFSWSAPFASSKNAAIQPGLAHTPLYTENLTLEDMLLVKERIEAIQQPLGANLRLRESRAYRAVPRYLWGFTKVRSVDDLRKRGSRGVALMSALVKHIKTKVATRR